jgi:hypothetical protein
MAPLPASRRHDPWGRYAPQARDTVRAYPAPQTDASKPRSGIGMLVLAAAVGLGAGYLAQSPHVTAPQRSDRPTVRTASHPTRAPVQPASGRCREPDNSISNWGVGNPPVFGDPMHWLPPCDGRRR